MSERLIPALALCALIVAGFSACGDDGEEVQRACSPSVPSSEGWQEEGRYVNLNSGRVDVGEFNEFLAGAEPPTSTSPCDAARVFLHLDQRQGVEGPEWEVSAVPGDSADAEVEVTLTGLADDSIRAQRWTFTFEPGEGEGVQLATARVEHSCHPGRGHRAFSAEPCV